MNPEGAAGRRALVLSEVQGLQKHAAACRVLALTVPVLGGSQPGLPFAASNKVLSLNSGAKDVPRRK